MKIVPLTSKTVDYVSERYSKDVTFVLKIFDMTEYQKFKQMAVNIAQGKEKDLAKLYQKVIDFGIVDVKGIEGSKLKLEPFMYEDLCDQLTMVNRTTVVNVKK